MLPLSSMPEDGKSVAHPAFLISKRRCKCCQHRQTDGTADDADATLCQTNHMAAADGGGACFNHAAPGYAVDKVLT